MKKVLLLTAFGCFSFSLLKAQDKVSNENYYSIAFEKNSAKSTSVFDAPIPANQNRMFIKTEEHWRKLRNNGIVLTSLGAACITAGAVLVNADIYDIDGNADGTRAVFGILGIAGGITSLGGGITMWAIGNNRLRKIRDFSIRTGGSAVGLVYKF